jgi:PIN domain nuclease of toxin-antitoxin system
VIDEGSVDRRQNGDSNRFSRGVVYWYTVLLLAFESEVRASNSQKQNAVTVSALSGSELKLKTE